jgi:two-component system, OmpR family, response regulator
MHVLIVEDDAETAHFIQKGLQEAGHVVEHARDGRDGLHRATSARYDAVVVDRTLPQLDGLSVVHALRASGSRTPVVFLTALDSVDERVRGLRAGGDDYLGKPFSLDELLARLDAVTRRADPANAPSRLRVADLELDRLTHSVRRAGQTVVLTPLEYRLLEYLMTHAGQVVTRSMLLEQVWGYHFDPRTNVVDVHISHLRERLNLPGSAPLIQTMRGAGYMLRAPR